MRLTSCTEMRHDSAHHATDAEQLQDATDCSTDTDATHNAKRDKLGAILRTTRRHTIR